jgi:hypothetical protein
VLLNITLMVCNKLNHGARMFFTVEGVLEDATDEVVRTDDRSGDVVGLCDFGASLDPWWGLSGRTRCRSRLWLPSSHGHT